MAPQNLTSKQAAALRDFFGDDYKQNYGQDTKRVTDSLRTLHRAVKYAAPPTVKPGELPPTAVQGSQGQILSLEATPGNSGADLKLQLRLMSKLGETVVAAAAGENALAGVGIRHLQDADDPEAVMKTCTDNGVKVVRTLTAVNNTTAELVQGAVITTDLQPPEAQLVEGRLDRVRREDLSGRSATAGSSTTRSLSGTESLNYRKGGKGSTEGGGTSWQGSAGDGTSHSYAENTAINIVSVGEARNLTQRVGEGEGAVFDEKGYAHGVYDMTTDTRVRSIAENPTATIDTKAQVAATEAAAQVQYPAVSSPYTTPARLAPIPDLPKRQKAPAQVSQREALSGQKAERDLRMTYNANHPRQRPVGESGRYPHEYKEWTVRVWKGQIEARRTGENLREWLLSCGMHDRWNMSAEEGEYWQERLNDRRDLPPIMP
jgi:hypothetical protein